MIKSVLAASLACAALFGAKPCLATTIIDPPDDFLSTYIGQIGPDLDILQFTVTMDEANFLLAATMKGAPGLTASSRYNIGVNRGVGGDRFGGGFRPGTSFDTTINLVPAGLGGEVRLFGATQQNTPLPAGAISISGNSISAVIPISMLPSTGFATENYTFLLWSRTNVSGSSSAPTLGIADFAPDNGSIRAVPEPTIWGMMLAGFGAVGAAIRRRRKHIISISACACR